MPPPHTTLYLTMAVTPLVTLITFWRIWLQVSCDHLVTPHDLRGDCSICTEGEEQQAPVLHEKAPPFPFPKYTKMCDREGAVPTQVGPCTARVLPSPLAVRLCSGQRAEPEAQLSEEKGDSILPLGLLGSSVADSLCEVESRLPIVQPLRQSS